MRKIPFQVSAKTARLIGRENVANADGAVIELVKNGYDADADFCIIYFDNKYSDVPKTLNTEEFNILSKEEELVAFFYVENEDAYSLDISKRKEDEMEYDELFKNLQAFFRSKNSIYIIDNGIGMDDEIIEKHWMTIGTNYKEVKTKTKSGKRVLTGAKGIGRFALDRLGNKGKMVTRKEDENLGYQWNVNWSDFEKNNEVISNVYANLQESPQIDISKGILDIVAHFNESEELKTEILSKIVNNNGTIIKVSNLRDNWNSNAVNHVFENLQTLIPPKEERDFNIFLASSLNPEKYGLVKNFACEDYDYKLDANVDEQQNVSITIYRNEFTLHNIDEDFFFNHKNIKNKVPYAKSIFKKGVFTYKITLAQLLSIEGEDEESIEKLSKIGAFTFSFYFLKRSLSEKDKKKYSQKAINAAFRKDWMKEFGGIKLFRDDFRVRPYGESGTSSFDWLELGNRSSGTTNQPSKSGWKVRPTMVAGVVNISRLANLNFKDKSNREGLQENITFDFFKDILRKLVREFEKDRYPIMEAFGDLHVKNNKNEETKEKADEVIRNSKNDSQSEPYDEKTEVVSKAYEIVKEEIKELANENKILRVLASTGLTVTAFTHELKTIQNNLENRVESVINVLQDGLLVEDKVNALPKFKRPIRILSHILEQDRRLKQWLDFALNAIKRDKRRRKNIELVNYFNELKENWESILNAKGVELNLNTGIWIEIIWRGFSIDLDTIFNNLIVNSVEAFKRKDFKSIERKISITLSRTIDEQNAIHIIYEDSGPGIPGSILNVDEIFDFNFTTKKDPIGRTIGTGIGMWLIKSVIDEYEGNIDIIRARPKFKTKLIIPVKKKN